MELQSIDQLLEKTKLQAKKRVLAVAAADSKNALEAVIKARDEGLVTPLLIGDRAGIKKYLDELGASVEDGEIVDQPDNALAAAEAVRLINEGKAEFMMKGMIQTADFMRAIIDKEIGLIDPGNVVSFVSINEMNNYHKLLIMTDTGLIRDPDLMQKKGIIENAVKVFRAYGYEKPKVAVMTAVETVNPKMQETVDAAELEEMNKRGEIKDCIVEGPISMDIAFSKRVAELKGYKGIIPGDVDIVIWPNVLAGNIAAKGIAMFGGRLKSLSFGAGARVPLVIAGRGADAGTEYLTILGALAAF